MNFRELNEFEKAIIETYRRVVAGKAKSMQAVQQGVSQKTILAYQCGKIVRVDIKEGW